MQGQGGSYIRNKDGSLELTARTLPPEAAKPADNSAPTSGATKKKES